MFATNCSDSREAVPLPMAIKSISNSLIKKNRNIDVEYDKDMNELEKACHPEQILKLNVREIVISDNSNAGFIVKTMEQIIPKVIDID